MAGIHIYSIGVFFKSSQRLWEAIALQKFCTQQTNAAKHAVAHSTCKHMLSTRWWLLARIMIEFNQKNCANSIRSNTCIICWRLHTHTHIQEIRVHVQALYRFYLHAFLCYWFAPHRNNNIIIISLESAGAKQEQQIFTQTWRQLHCNQHNHHQHHHHWIIIHIVIIGKCFKSFCGKWNGKS